MFFKIQIFSITVPLKSPKFPPSAENLTFFSFKNLTFFIFFALAEQRHGFPPSPCRRGLSRSILKVLLRWRKARPCVSCLSASASGIMARIGKQRKGRTLIATRPDPDEPLLARALSLDVRRVPVERIPTCLATGESPKYPITTIGRHYEEMYGKTYGPGGAAGDR